MALVIALLPDHEMLSRLRRALRVDQAVRARHSLTAAADWDGVEQLAAAGAPHLLVFDPYASGRLEMGRCAEFARRYPSVSILPYGDVARGHPRDLIQLAVIGVREVLIRGQDDRPATLYLALCRMFSGSVDARVVDELGGRLPPQLEPFVRTLVSAAVAPLGPADAARLYRRHSNTLREHLRAAGFPPINKMIVWARLFQAAHLLEDPVRSAENVALALDFPSASALRNQFHRYVGMPPAGVRAGGGVRAVARAFLNALGSADTASGCPKAA